MDIVFSHIDVSAHAIHVAKFLRATWGITKIFFTLVFFPLILIGLVAAGFLYIALPILLIVGIITWFFRTVF